VEYGLAFVLGLAVYAMLIVAFHPINKRRHAEQGSKGLPLRAQYGIGAMAAAMWGASPLLDSTVMTIAFFLGVGVAFGRRMNAVHRRSAR